MRRLWSRTPSALVCTALVLAGSLGCDDRPESTVVLDLENRPLPPDLTGRKGYVAVVASGKDDPYWSIIKTGAQRYDEDLGGVKLRFAVPKGNSPKDQIDLLKSLDQPELLGLCIHPASEEAILPALEPISRRGLPIVTMLTPLACDWPRSHVGLDPAEVGRALAELTAQALNERGTIMLLHAGIEHDVYGPRRRSFLEHLQRYSGIELFAQIDGERSPRRARSLIRERSQRYPRLDAWVCLDDWPLRDHRDPASLFNPPTRIITVGGTPQHAQLIRLGLSPGVVGAHYYELGSQAVQACHVALLDREQSRPIRTTLPARIVTEQNLMDYLSDWHFWETGESGGAGPMDEERLRGVE